MAQFWVDIYSAAGVRQNEHTQEVSGVRITQRINQIGECEFTMPAVVAYQLGSGAGLRYSLYHETLGYLGQFIQTDMTLDADQKTVSVKAHDQLAELSNFIIGFGKAYDGTWALSEILTNDPAGIFATVNWHATFETDFDAADRPASMEFRGESILRGLDIMRQYYRGYFRLEGDRQILFGDFHSQEITDTVTPVARIFGPALATADTTDFATITSFRRERKGSNIVNRVYALGAGIGETQVDMRYSTRTAIQPEPGYLQPSYTIIRQTFSAAEDAYLIQDNESIDQYGTVEGVLVFTEIRPITNSAADLENAGNALYDLAEAFIKQHREEQDIYSLSCVNLPATVKPGDPVRIDYRGVAKLETGDVAYLSIDNRIMFVTQITRSFGPSGAAVAELVVSRSGDDIVGTTNVLSSVMSDVQRLKLRVQPHMTYFNRASPTLPIDATRYIDFTFYLGNEVLALNEMKIEFRVMPLRSYSNTVSTAASSVGTTASGGGSSPTSSSGGGSTPTTSSDPGGSVTSGNSGGLGDHTHNVTIFGSGAGTTVYWDGGLGGFSTFGGPYVSTTDTNSATHNHSVTIPSHNHSVTITAHSHTVTISDHTHGITIPAHNHTLSFGVTDDTVTPNTLTVKVNSTAVGGIVNAATGVVIGSSVTGAGLYLVDILSVLTATDFRDRTHTIRFECASGQGQVFAQVLGRVTIQPIAVT
ncbi:MAG TPA: hypothetical protein PL187_11020 [Caldilinea sp.]|nr:hypothetical protein [Caldilinea sp.]